MHRYFCRAQWIGFIASAWTFFSVERGIFAACTDYDQPPNHAGAPSLCLTSSYDTCPGTDYGPTAFYPEPGCVCYTGSYSDPACAGYRSGVCCFPITPPSPSPSPSPSPLPSPSPSPLPSPSPSPWGDHLCGSAGIAPSAGIPMGLNSDQMANPKFACCLNGWWEAGLGTQKLDCLATPSTLREFDQLYFYNYTGADPFLQDGLNRPNRVFIRDSVTGQPIPGFYNTDGRRCAYLDAGGNPTQLTIQQQYDLFDMAIANRAVPAPVVPLHCNRLLRTAVEVECPASNPHPSTGITWTVSSGAERRCSAAVLIKLHLALDDLSNPSVTKRPVYHRVTTFDPGFSLSTQSLADHIPTSTIPFYRWIHLISPGSCLLSPGLVFSAGRCEIKTTP